MKVMLTPDESTPPVNTERFSVIPFPTLGHNQVASLLLACVLFEAAQIKLSANLTPRFSISIYRSRRALARFGPMHPVFLAWIS